MAKFMRSTRDLPFEIDPDAIAVSCRARGIVPLSVWESALRNDFDPKQSDVDENAKFSDGALDAVCREFALYGDALSKIIGLRVYLVTNPLPSCARYWQGRRSRSLSKCDPRGRFVAQVRQSLERDAHDQSVRLMKAAPGTITLAASVRQISGTGEGNHNGSL